MRLRHQPAASAAVTVAGVLLVFAPAVVGMRTLSQRDTDLLYAPVRTLVVKELRAGRLPLWNPHEALGKPLFAEGIHSVLHPISLFGAAVAPSSIDFLILAYLVAAALGAFVLARALEASPTASAAGGLAFALSGFSVSMTGNLVFLAGLSTLPWLVAAIRATGAGARWGGVAAALATACAFLSGDAQTTAVGLVIGAILAAEAGGARGIARAIAAIVPGVLLAGIQIVPTLELIPRTVRGVELPDSMKTHWALAPGRLFEWVVPGLFRGPLDEFPVSSSGALLETPFADSVYLGAPILIAAALGIRQRRRLGLVLGVAGLFLVWLALGHHLGSRQVLDWVPIWNRFRYSEKLMAPFTLCVCAMGALGIDAFGAGRLSRGLRWTLVACGLGAGAVLITLLLAPVTTEELATHVLGVAGSFYRSNLEAGLPHLLIALGGIIAADRLRDGPKRASAMALTVALVSALGVYFGAHLGSREVRRFATPLRLDGDAATPRIVHAADLATGPGDPDGAVDGFARIESLLLGQAIGVAHHVDTMWTYGAFDPLRLTGLGNSVGDQWAEVFRRFGETHVIGQLPRESRPAIVLAVRDGRLVQRDEALRFEVWSVPHRPWTFFARRVAAETRPDAARRALLDLAMRGDDGTVVVEASEPPPVASGGVLGIERDAESLRVEAESAGPALLVIQDAYWPGWRASIDGRPTDILAADYVVRAVRWPEGRHRLEMVYDPPEIRMGLACSAVGVVAVLILAATSVYRIAISRRDWRDPSLTVGREARARGSTPPLR
jgi:hypothetical protein